MGFLWACLRGNPESVELSFLLFCQMFSVQLESRPDVFKHMVLPDVFLQTSKRA